MPQHEHHHHQEEEEEEEEGEEGEISEVEEEGQQPNGKSTPTLTASSSASTPVFKRPGQQRHPNAQASTRTPWGGGLSGYSIPSSQPILTTGAKPSFGMAISAPSLFDDDGKTLAGREVKRPPTEGRYRVDKSILPPPPETTPQRVEFRNPSGSNLSSSTSKDQQRALLLAQKQARDAQKQQGLVLKQEADKTMKAIRILEAGWREESRESWTDLDRDRIARAALTIHSWSQRQPDDCLAKPKHDLFALFMKQQQPSSHTPGTIKPPVKSSSIHGK